MGNISLRDEQPTDLTWRQYHRGAIQFVQPRLQIQRDRLEAARVASLFEELRHIDDREWEPAGAAPDSGPNGSARACRSILLPALLVSAAVVYVPRVAPPVGALFACAALGPVLRWLSAVTLRIARANMWSVVVQVVYLNGMLLMEERAVGALLVAWASHPSWALGTEQRRKLVLQPSLALMFLLLTNGFRKMVEFAFLASRMRDRFKADVLANAFERAALQRLTEMPKDQEAGKVRLAALRQAPVLPGMDDPHLFERCTADMLRTAFGPQQVPGSEATSSPRSRSGVLQKAKIRWARSPSLSFRSSAESKAVPASPELDGAWPADTLKNLLRSSTTMFVMQMEGKFVEIEAEAESLFGHLARVPRSDFESRLGSANGGVDDHASEGEPRIFRCDLDNGMLAKDAHRTWLMLTLPIGVDDGAGARGYISKHEFVEAVSGTFERFHRIAASVKDYAAIWLVFSDVLMCTQIVVSVVIILAVFFPPEVLRTLSITVSTVFVGLSFVFGGLLREIFESVVLILVVQPYGVGDRIRLKDGEERKIYTVQKINILTTEVRDLHNQCVYIKNSALYHEATIVNLGRSLNAVVEVSFDLPAVQVTPSLISELNKFVKHYVTSKPMVWVPSYIRSFSPITQGLAQCDVSGAVQHRFRLMHRKPWQSVRDIRQDTTEVLYTILDELRRLKVDFRLPVQPIHIDGIDVCWSVPAKAAATNCAEGDARPVPTLVHPKLGHSHVDALAARLMRQFSPDDLGHVVSYGSIEGPELSP